MRKHLCAQLYTMMFGQIHLFFSE